MENNVKKCSLKEHSEINASIYCQECNVYMCNKCSNFHSRLCQNHHTKNIDKENKDVFTGICQEKKHSIELKYFCINHNKLCCAACLSKVEDEEYGQHKNCKFCTIETIKEEKENKLDENIKYLEELSNNIDLFITELKINKQKFEQNKEDLKQKIQIIFTRLRNAMNQREDEILLEIDQKSQSFLQGDLLNKSEKIKNKIKVNLEKGKTTKNQWNDENNLKSLINDCISIENNLCEINEVNEKIKKVNSLKLDIKFEPQEDEILDFIQTIKNFGELNYQEIENNIYNDLEKRIKQGFTNIVGLSLQLNIPIKYIVIPVNQNEEKKEEEKKEEPKNEEPKKEEPKKEEQKKKKWGKKEKKRKKK